MTAHSVVFAMEWVPQYRVDFYDGLRVALAARDIDMRLVHGDPPASRRRRRDDGVLAWAERVPNRFWTVRGLELTWQPVLRRLSGADLVIVQQETGLLLNYLMMARSRLPGGPAVGVWGHGHNFNPLEANGQAEWVKAKVTRFADWAFAYTERSAAVFRSIGMADDRITVVQNSRSADPVAGEPAHDVATLVAGLRRREARVGWMVSALDGWKRVPFLIEVLDEIRRRCDRFEFVILGAGTESATVDQAAAERPWLHAPGPLFGADKAVLGELAEVTIHPGLAGLHVIDTFVTRSPMVTADIEYHSHETDYLRHDENSLVLPAGADVGQFADAVNDLFNEPDRLARLQLGCDDAAARYTLEAMVENFAGGVAAALDRARR